ncbi:MAG: hypothetical protein AB7E09_05615 [Candidatus Izemoplasmatales bacterium]
MLYKKKFIISIYDKNDQLITVVDNVFEFARLFNKTYEQAHAILSRIFLKKRQSFYHNNEKLFIAFIED